MIIHIRDNQGVHRKFALTPGNWTMAPLHGMVNGPGVDIMVELTNEDQSVWTPKTVDQIIGHATRALTLAESRARKSRETTGVMEWAAIGHGWAQLAAIIKDHTPERPSRYTDPLGLHTDQIPHTD